MIHESSVERELYIRSEVPIIPVPIAEWERQKALLHQTDDLVGRLSSRRGRVRCRRRLWPIVRRLARWEAK